MLPFDLCKFGVFYLFETILFISFTNAGFHLLKSDSQELKIIPKNESKYEYYTSNANKWNGIQIAETRLNSNEYLDAFVNNRQLNESFLPSNELPWEKENSHHYHDYNNDGKKDDSNEMQMIYWYYDKVTAVILGIFFGIAMNLENAKVILKQPIGPAIGIFCKFILSPFVSLTTTYFYISHSFFSQNSPIYLMDFNGFGFCFYFEWGVFIWTHKKLSYKLGLIFFTQNILHRYELISNGITLMKFVAVCWTTILDGTIDLSITLTIINTQLYLGKIGIFPFQKQNLAGN